MNITRRINGDSSHFNNICRLPGSGGFYIVDIRKTLSSEDEPDDPPLTPRSYASGLGACADGEPGRHRAGATALAHSPECAAAVHAGGTGAALDWRSRAVRRVAV